MILNKGSMSLRTVVAGLVGASVFGGMGPAYAAEPVVTVYKDPNCGCCSGWIQHLTDAGFTVRQDETADLDSVRTRLGVPSDLFACHTAVVSGYVIEGHVPAPAIRRLLSEGPVARGLAVPGMPAGSPGMEGGPLQPYNAILFGAEGRHPFMNFIGKRTVG